MSITLKCYKNLSDRRTAAKNLTLIANKSVELKGDTDIVNPTLIVTGDAATYAGVNYVEIPAFKRFYHATCESLPGGLVRISCSCDVLSSAWAHGLQDCTAIIARQENEWNLYLNDGTFQAYANDQIQTKEFSGGFTTPSYVLIVAG